MGEGVGKVKEAVGWATGDRGVEAEGRVDQQDRPTTDDAVADEEREVREEYNELAPDDAAGPADE